MLKLLHTADLHFGRSKHSGLDSETGLSTSLVNDMQAFNEIIDIAFENNVDIFVLAGDIFDKIHVSNAVRKEVAKCFRRILERHHMYVIVGTHDRAHDKYAAHTLSDWMNLSGGDSDHMSRLHIFEQPSSVYHVDDSGNNLGQIIALPEPTRGLLEGKTYTQYVSDFFETIEIREDLPVLLIGHFTIAGAKTGDEVNDLASFRPDEGIAAAFFDDKKIDYVALGHIHRPQELGKYGKIVYPGSLNYCSFTEVNLKKGGYIVQINNDKTIEKKFISLKSPIPLIELKLDLCNIANPMDALRRFVAESIPEKSIVKLLLTMHEDEYKLLDESEVNKLLKDCVSFNVSYDVIRALKMRDSSITVETTLEEAYDKHLAVMGYSEEIISALKSDFKEIVRLSETQLQLDSSMKAE